MTYLFIDTNIFLHYKFFIEIPWQTIFDDQFEIVLAPVIVDELDKHKRHQNQKIAARAKKVLSRFEEIVGSSDSFPLKYIFNRPLQETFDHNQLDRKEQDDSILATILEFIIDHPNDQIKLISNDTGPRFRAASLGIDAAKLDDEYLIPVEKTEEQKLIHKLTQENSNYKNKIPKISLCFKDGALLLTPKLTEVVETIEEYIRPRIATLKEKHQPLVWEDPEIARAKLSEASQSQPEGTLFGELLRSTKLAANFGMHSTLSKEQVGRYNKELNDFFEDYKQFLNEKFTLKIIKSLSLPIEIKMKNDGNVPAIDIDIWLHFPDGFELMILDEYPKKPTAPKLPYLPKHRYDFGPTFVSSLGAIHNPVHGYAPNLNLNEPIIKKTNSYEVDIHYKSLKHCQSHNLDQLILVYPSYDKIINFTIDYKINISNVPDPILGQLSVKAELDVKPTESSNPL